MMKSKQLDFVYNQLLYGQIASIVCSSFMVFLLWGSINNFWLGSWFSALSLLSLLRLLTMPAYLNHAQRAEVYSRYKYIFIGGAFLGSLIWSASILFLGNITEHSLQFGIILIIAGITAGSISTNAAILPAYAAFQLPILLTLTAWLLLQQTPAFTKLAVLTVFYASILMILAKRYRDQFVTVYSMEQLNKELIERLIKANSSLITAKETAERTNRAKSEFLSTMNHELRTPLNAIIGFAQVLKLNNTNTQQQNDQLNEIHIAGKHLLNLINETLDIARIESGRIELNMQVIRLDNVLHECLALTMPLANTRKIKLTISETELNMTCIYADHTRLKQVILNLLSNALKYNHDNGAVTIHCSQTDDQYLLVNISDTGPGISPERQAELFQPFNRLDADDNGIEGTGIGLTISKKLLEMMEGKISVESTPGQGSTFSIALLLADSKQIASTA